MYFYLLISVTEIIHLFEISLYQTQDQDHEVLYQDQQCINRVSRDTDTQVSRTPACTAVDLPENVFISI